MITVDGVGMPTRLGRYQVIEALGRGAMGAVFRGRDPELARDVAIKIVAPSSIGDTSASELAARFRREAQALAGLRHPHVIQVYDFGVDDVGRPFLVMEYLAGTTLDRVLGERGRLPALEVVAILRQVASGLAAAHGAHIVHRDIKPSNLFVCGDGTVKLLDFGIARSLASGSTMTAAGSTLGTPSYMAPEQAGGREVDGRADLYALGMTAFELLSGAPPFVADDVLTVVVQQVTAPLPNLRARVPGLPEELVQWVERLTAKEPSARPASAAEVEVGLGALQARLDGRRSADAVMPTLAMASSPAPGAVATGATGGAGPEVGVRVAFGRSADAVDPAAETQGRGRPAVAALAATSLAPSSAPTVPRADESAKAATTHEGAGRPAGAPSRTPLVVLGILAVASVATALVIRAQRTPDASTATTTTPPPSSPPGRDDKPGPAGSPAVPDGGLGAAAGTAGAAVAGAAAGGAATAGRTATAVAPAASTLRVGVLRFRNLGAAELSGLEQGIGETVVSALAGAVAGATFIERADIASNIQEIDRADDLHFDKLTVAEKGRLTGVDVVVQGAFQTVAKDIRVTSRLVAVETGEILATWTVTQAARDLFAVQDAVAAGLRTKIAALVAARKAPASGDGGAAP